MQVCQAHQTCLYFFLSQQHYACTCIQTPGVRVNCRCTAFVICCICCSIQDSLESAELCNSSGNAQHESLGLVIAVMAEKCLGVHSRSGSTCHSALQAAPSHFFSIVTHSHDIAIITETVQGSMWSPINTELKPNIMFVCNVCVQ